MLPNRLRHRFPLLLPLALLAGAAASPLQEGAGQGSGGIEAVGRRSAELQPIVQRQLASNGGAERVEALIGFDLAFTDVAVEDPAEEGGERVERPGETIQMSIGMAVSDRRVRMVQPLATGDTEREMVRIAAGEGMAVLIDGERRDSEELANEARGIAIELLVVLDLVWGLVNGQINATPGVPRKRDGVTYDTVEAQFPEGRGLASAFRLYYDTESGLLRRCDQFNLSDGRRVVTLLFDDYVAGKGIQMPTRVSFLDRDRVLQRYWRFDGLAVDPEWPDTHFSVE